MHDDPSLHQESVLAELRRALTKLSRTALNSPSASEALQEVDGFVDALKLLAPISRADVQTEVRRRRGDRQLKLENFFSLLSTLCGLPPKHSASTRARPPQCVDCNEQYLKVFRTNTNRKPTSNPLNQLLLPSSLFFPLRLYQARFLSTQLWEVAAATFFLQGEGADAAGDECDAASIVAVARLRTGAAELLQLLPASSAIFVFTKAEMCFKAGVSWRKAGSNERAEQLLSRSSNFLGQLEEGAALARGLTEDQVRYVLVNRYNCFSFLRAWISSGRSYRP